MRDLNNIEQVQEESQRQQGWSRRRKLPKALTGKTNASEVNRILE